MASTRVCLWLLFMIITQAIAQDIRSMEMSLMIDSKFQCANTTCFPFISVITSNIRNCQVACLAESQCIAATFHRSTSGCELFDNMLNQNGNMLADVDSTSMNVISGTRFPPEPSTANSTTPAATTTPATTTSTTTTRTASTTTAIAKWTMTGNLSVARFGHISSTLVNGSVLVAGGYNGGYLNSAELYDPTTGTWTTTANMSITR
ncbi:unnamed protein product, partial [Adineta steineri]